MSRLKRKIDIVPRSRYMSIQMGQLAVADIREILPGDLVRHRCRIGVHLSPMQAPELSPIMVRQDTYFTPNRILWDYWDNYISQKLLEDTAVGPFDENKLLPPQLAIFLGAGLASSTAGGSRHLSDVRGVYDCLEGLGLKLALTDVTPRSSDTTLGIDGLGTLLQFNAFPLMAYWRIWHDYYRDPFLQNDAFKAFSLNRTPDFGDPWADEQPLLDSDVETNTVKNWDTPLTNQSSSYNTGVTGAGSTLPGYLVDVFTAGTTPHQRIRGIFTFAKRHPAMGVVVNKQSASGSTTPSLSVLPGVCSVIPADVGTVDPQLGVLPATGGLGFYAPVCMPKDYFFTARQSPVYNEDVVVPGSVRDLRKAFQVLGYREKINRFDNRIKAWMRSMFGVNISDKRLDSPYWLGGSQSVINTQEILGTVNNTDTVLGQLGGFGIGAVRGRTVKMRSEDHGFLMTVFYIVPLPVYGDGVSRYWYRGALNNLSRTPFADGPLDWPLPDFARIGQQSIYRGELSANGNTGTDSSPVYSGYRETFGFGDRYSDMSFSNSDVCGDFRTTLRFWHTGLFFGNSMTALSPQDADLSKVSGVSGDFVSLFSRVLNNVRQSRTGQVRSSISSNLSARLFDSGVTADPFWCVVSTDFYCSRRIPTHPQPGHADHTRRN